MKGLSMGWSESYYEDMRREAREVLGKRVGPLLEEIKEFRNILMTYNDFIDACNETESLLARLEDCLAEYLVGE
jgi:hypothetical protein